MGFSATVHRLITWFVTTRGRRRTSRMCVHYTRCTTGGFTSSVVSDGGGCTGDRWDMTKDLGARWTIVGIAYEFLDLIHKHDTDVLALSAYICVSRDRGHQLTHHVEGFLAQNVFLLKPKVFFYTEALFPKT